MTKLDFSHPLWGLSEDDGIPNKSILFTDHLAMEDFLQHNAVFLNGISGKTCHSDSYMTVVDYTALDKAFKVLNDTYSPTKEDWLYNVGCWLSNPNMQPPLRIVALTVARQFAIDTKEYEKERLSKDWR